MRCETASSSTHCPTPRNPVAPTGCPSRYLLVLALLVCSVPAKGLATSVVLYRGIRLQYSMLLPPVQSMTPHARHSGMLIWMTFWPKLTERTTTITCG